MKRTYFKRVIVFTVATILAMASVALAGCGCDINKLPTATTDEAGNFVPATVATLGETDQAVVDAGLSVNDNGDIVDSEGNKVEVSDDGKGEDKTANSKKVKVDASTVKTANENKTNVDKINDEAAELQRAAYESEMKNNQNQNNQNNNNNGGSSGGSNQSSKTNGGSNQTNKPSGGSSQTSSGGQSSKPNQSSQSSQSIKPNQNSQTSQTSSGGQTSKPNQTSNSGGGESSKPQQSSQSSTVDPHEGKTWHEAEYKTVNHPAETKQVWVVDVPEHEETVVKTKKVRYVCICAGCGAVMDSWSDEAVADHAYNHYLNGEANGWGSGYVDEPVTETKTVPEQGHYETRVVKEAWTEKVLVRKAGWY